MRILRPRGGRRLGEQGQSLLEMALVLPILLALVIGIVELGRAWNVRQVITNAAREGARRAVIQTSTEAAVEAVVGDYLDDAGIDPGAATIDIVGMDGSIGTYTTITVSYPHSFLFLGPVVDLLTEDGGSTVPGSITLVSSATMRNESN